MTCSVILLTILSSVEIWSKASKINTTTTSGSHNHDDNMWNGKHQNEKVLPTTIAPIVIPTPNASEEALVEDRSAYNYIFITSNLLLGLPCVLGKF